MSWYCGSQDTTMGLVWSMTSGAVSRMFSCVTITPLGAMVEPEVYCRKRIFET